MKMMFCTFFLDSSRRPGNYLPLFNSEGRSQQKTPDLNFINSFIDNIIPPAKYDIDEVEQKPLFVYEGQNSHDTKEELRDGYYGQVRQSLHEQPRPSNNQRQPIVIRLPPIGQYINTNNNVQQNAQIKDDNNELEDKLDSFLDSILPIGSSGQHKHKQEMNPIEKTLMMSVKSELMLKKNIHPARINLVAVRYDTGSQDSLEVQKIIEENILDIDENKVTLVYDISQIFNWGGKFNKNDVWMLFLAFIYIFIYLDLYIYKIMNTSILNQFFS